MKVRLSDRYNRYTLSIGMIVKNEEKNLRACLEALKPLREAVSSELIIVDTGSEDETVQIAKEYTEKVYSYEWNKDFAAARNYGLDRATGRWFMFLDADEQLVACDELISFLNTKSEWENYFTAEIVIRNFVNIEENKYSDFTSARIFRLDTGNRFSGSIHEVPNRISPIKNLLQSRLDHFGYVYKSEEAKQKKFQRNNELLEIELEKSPDDVRLLCLYSVSCPDEKRLGLLEHSRELIKTRPEHYYFPETYWRLNRELVRLHEFEKAIEIGKEYRSLTTQDHVGEIEISYNLAYVYSELNDYEASLQECERYIELYSRYLDNSLLQQENASNVCEKAFPAVYNTIFQQMAEALLNLNQYEEAFETILKTDLTVLPRGSEPHFLYILFKIICDSEQFDWLITVDEWLKNLQLPYEREKPYITNIVNIYLQTTKETKISLGQTKSTTTFGQLLCLGSAGEDSVWENILALLTEEDLEAEKYGAVALYQALQNKKDPLPLLRSAKAETIQKWNHCLANQTKDLDQIVLEYHFENIKDEILLCFWLVDLETWIVNKCKEEYRLLFAHRLIEDVSQYVKRIYSKEVLCPEGLYILPSYHRFAYWCGKSLEAKSQGDTSGYIKFLGKASHICPEMAEVVKLLVEEVRDNDEALQARKEQETLAKNIKGIIEKLILNQSIEDARSILGQYEMIAPDDPDIPALKAALVQKSSFTEA